MPIFLCEFSEGQYQAFLDIKRQLREQRVEFDIERTQDEYKREVQRFWLAEPSQEAVDIVRRYFRKRHPLKSFGDRAGEILQRWKHKQR